MKLTDLDAYEVLEQCPLRDLKSEGLVLRHKKSGARIAVISMMMIIRYFISDSALRRRIPQVYHIL